MQLMIILLYLNKMSKLLFSKSTMYDFPNFSLCYKYINIKSVYTVFTWLDTTPSIVATLECLFIYLSLATGQAALLMCSGKKDLQIIS